MPRLRRLKNYDYIQEQTGRDTDEDNNRELETSDNRGYSETDSGESEEECDSGQDANFSQPRGWWSNASIIQGLPEPKIREALAHYRLLINQLEEELLVRRIPHNREPDLDIGSMRQVSSHSKYVPARKRERSSHFAKFLKREVRSLKPQARLKLEEAWSLILKEHYNDK